MSRPVIKRVVVDASTERRVRENMHAGSALPLEYNVREGPSPQARGHSTGLSGPRRLCREFA